MISRIKENMYMLTMLCLLVMSGYGMISCLLIQRATENDSKSLKRIIDIGDTGINAVHSDFEGLWEINPDIIGWITIGGTQVDYPVLYPGIDKDVDYYLYHTVLNDEKREGAIFVEPVNAGDFSDELTVVYGHNMKNNTMFGDLDEYVNPAFLEKNSEITLKIPGESIQYKIFAVVERGSANLISEYNVFEKEYNRASILEYINKEAIAVSQDFKDNGGRIIALSTCSQNDNRLVVFGQEKLNID